MKTIIMVLSLGISLQTWASSVLLDCPRIPYPDLSAAQVLDDQGTLTLRLFHGDQSTDKPLSTAEWEARSLRLPDYHLAFRRLEKSAGYWWVIVQAPGETLLSRLDDCTDNGD